MSNVRKSVFVVAASLALLMTGCETKASQCNKLIKVANTASTELQEMGKKSKASKDPKDQLALLTNLSDRLDQWSKDMNAVEVKDEKLLGFRGRAVQMYSDLRDASRSLVTALNAKDLKSAGVAVGKLEAGEKQESVLANEVNSYCSAK